MSLEIYDCTLREGEQAEGASFSLKDRIELCQALDNFGVDYIELGWPIASKEIFDSFKIAIKKVRNAKIVAFGSTSISKNVEEDENLNAIINCGAKYACIFGKTDLNHIEFQLKISDRENLEKISQSISFLIKNNIEVFYDAEHYFDGFKANKEYAIKTLISAINSGATRIILCDTNGGILPNEAKEIIKETSEILGEQGLNFELGVHLHNDSELALANTLICIPYLKQVQGTINGMGERMGNLNFSEFLPIYIKKMNNKTKINLKKLKEINEKTFRLAGIEIPEKRAFVGDLAFAHKGGIHIDALLKGASYEHENPEDFGNERILLLNSLGGRNSIVNLAKEFGYELDKNNEKIKNKIKKLFQELKEKENKGYKIGSLNAEKFLLIKKYFGENNLNFKIEEWNINSEYINGKENSCFRVGLRLNNELIEDEHCVFGGPIDAAFKTIQKILIKWCPCVEDLKILDFHVSIAKQKEEESTVRTKIEFKNGEEFSTVGVDSNMLTSAIEALENGFRYYLLKKEII
jgi:2-isopropylmalate synthase